MRRNKPLNNHVGISRHKEIGAQGLGRSQAEGFLKKTAYSLVIVVAERRECTCGEVEGRMMTKDQRNRRLFIPFFILFKDVQEMLMELALQGDREFPGVDVHVFAEGDIVKTLVTVFHHRYHGKVMPAVLLVVSKHRQHPYVDRVAGQHDLLDRRVSRPHDLRPDLVGFAP